MADPAPASRLAARAAPLDQDWGEINNLYS
jgi:hypothetical protein